MRRVIVNGRFLLRSRVTGVDRYARELLQELDNRISSGEIELAIPSTVKQIPEYKNIKVSSVGKLTNQLWEQISFPAYVRKKRGIALNLCNVAPLRTPGIVCIHDVKIKARPQDFSKKFLLWYTILFANACKKAEKIITVSEFSKKEICKYYKVDPNRIVVIPNAWQHFQRIGFDNTALQKYELPKGDFFFSVCSLEPNKNLRWIAESAKMNPEKTFAVAGAVNKKVFSEGLGFECPDNMRLLGYVSDEEAKTLMRDCEAFLFPSFYEGFGIPPMEAISAGCKNVMVSDTEVMHEVYGSDVDYIDPMKPSVLIMKTNEKGKTVLSNYSWKTSSEKLLHEVIQQVE